MFQHCTNLPFVQQKSHVPICTRQPSLPLKLAKKQKKTYTNALACDSKKEHLVPKRIEKSKMLFFNV